MPFASQNRLVQRGPIPKKVRFRRQWGQSRSAAVPCHSHSGKLIRKIKTPETRRIPDPRIRGFRCSNCPAPKLLLTKIGLSIQPSNGGYCARRSDTPTRLSVPPNSSRAKASAIVHEPQSFSGNAIKRPISATVTRYRKLMRISARCSAYGVGDCAVRHGSSRRSHSMRSTPGRGTVVKIELPGCPLGTSG
jgi:hypothetical protein